MSVVSNKVIAAYLLFALIALQYACGSAQAAGSGRLSCESYAFNFGVLAETCTVTKVFELKNTGSGVLDISKVRTCCGASAGVVTNTVPAGGSTALTIQMPLAGRSGAFTKSIYVLSNDPVNPVCQFEIKGEVTPEPRASGMVLNLVTTSNTVPGWVSGVASSNQPAVSHDTVLVQPGMVYLGTIGASSTQSVTIAVSRGIGETNWKQVWAACAIVQGQELVEISPNESGNSRLSLWVYPLADGKVAVDSTLALHTPEALNSTVTAVLGQNVPSELLYKQSGDAEYKVIQTVKVLSI